MFQDIEIEKNKFQHYEGTVSLKNVDIEKILVSNKISFGEKKYKYFIDYLYKDQGVKPLYVILPKQALM